MTKQSPYASWDFADLQSRYEKAQLLANDCTQDFAGNYFFPSDRSPKGFWTTTRKQRLDYACDCPDFAHKIESQITNSAPSRWVRGDWSTRPDNTQLVNRCLHCLAVAIAEQELDTSFPVNRIYQAKRSRLPSKDCGCGCGGSGSCGCPSEALGLPEPRLIQGCETECYVEPLTPRTQRTPSTGEGIPAYQTFEIQKIEFAETEYQACFGDSVTIRLRRSTSQGFNNATVVGLPTDIEFPFSPELRTSSKEVTLDFFAPGIYTIGIGAIAVGNFGDVLEAQIEVLDCGNDLDNIDCPPDEFVDFSDGYCEGSYFVAFRQTGKKNPDGSCERLKVLQFQEGLNCPFPEELVNECESTIPRDCDPTRLGVPICVDTETGDGYNSNAGFNAVVKVQTGRKKTEYLRPDKKECAEYCDFVERLIHSPSCPNKPRKPIPEPFCPIPINRYTGWVKESAYLVSASINGITVYETFKCDDGTAYYLLGYTAKCMAPANRYVDSFAAASYGGNQFDEGCCPFDETKPSRPACPPQLPTTKWKCQDGVCVEDVNGVYTSQAQCQAALIPPSFTGGQCVVLYTVRYILYQTNMSGVESLAFSGEETQNVQGAIGSARVLLITLTPSNGYEQVRWQIQSNGGYFELAAKAGGGGLGLLAGRVEILSVVRVDGLPDNCGNLPSTCP